MTQSDFETKNHSESMTKWVVGSFMALLMLITVWVLGWIGTSVGALLQSNSRLQVQVAGIEASVLRIRQSQDSAYTRREAASNKEDVYRQLGGMEKRLEKVERECSH